MTRQMHKKMTSIVNSYVYMTAMTVMMMLIVRVITAATAASAATAAADDDNDDDNAPFRSVGWHDQRAERGSAEKRIQLSGQRGI